MFHIGQQVRVRRTHYKVKPGAIGTVIGYYKYYDDDEEEWGVDTSDLLIRFNPEDIDTSYQDWNNELDDHHPLGDFYLDAYDVEAWYNGNRMEFTHQAVESRHIEYQKRMLL